MARGKKVSAEKASVKKAAGKTALPAQVKKASIKKAPVKAVASEPQKDEIKALKARVKELEKKLQKIKALVD